MHQNKVSLQPCYYWTCDICGMDSYYYPLETKLTPQDIEECKIHFGPDFDPETVTATLIPKTVVCKHCKASFDVEPKETDLL